MPRASGPVAIANSEPKKKIWDLDGRTVFFHEYLHHLMLQDATAAYPTWMTEGYAEFFATAEIRSDGSVEFVAEGAGVGDVLGRSGGAAGADPAFDREGQAEACPQFGPGRDFVALSEFIHAADHGALHVGYAMEVGAEAMGVAGGGGQP